MGKFYQTIRAGENREMIWHVIICGDEVTSRLIPLKNLRLPPASLASTRAGRLSHYHQWLCFFCSKKNSKKTARTFQFAPF
jgi:hypothetical protein